MSNFGQISVFSNKTEITLRYVLLLNDLYHYRLWKISRQIFWRFLFTQAKNFVILNRFPRYLSCRSDWRLTRKKSRNFAKKKLKNRFWNVVLEFLIPANQTLNNQGLQQLHSLYAISITIFSEVMLFGETTHFRELKVRQVGHVAKWRFGEVTCRGDASAA